MRPFVNHQVVRLVESALAVFAYELALGPHLPPELPAAHVVIYLHYSEHPGPETVALICARFL